MTRRTLINRLATLAAAYLLALTSRLYRIRRLWPAKNNYLRTYPGPIKPLYRIWQKNKWSG